MAGACRQSPRVRRRTASCPSRPVGRSSAATSATKCSVRHSSCCRVPVRSKMLSVRSCMPCTASKRSLSVLQTIPRRGRPSFTNYRSSRCAILRERRNASRRHRWCSNTLAKARARPKSRSSLSRCHRYRPLSSCRRFGHFSAVRSVQSIPPLLLLPFRTRLSVVGAERPLWRTPCQGMSSTRLPQLPRIWRAFSHGYGQTDAARMQLRSTPVLQPLITRRTMLRPWRQLLTISPTICSKVVTACDPDILT
mmetsp:Transcript_19271/g.49303  ORF Transcript_19271/g.49303 Transcript_19271/m.49303 type:complete len:251 (-) Transcript_19271:472-1224(-)